MINPYLIEKNRKIENMTQVKIVTDSSVTIEPEVVKELDITVVPLSVMIDSVLYSDADLKEGEFLHLMQQSKNLPKTSQPPVGVFAEVFEWEDNVVDDNYLTDSLNNKNFLVFIAKIDDKIVGGMTAHILPNYERCKSSIYIYDLAVKESFQKQGIGKSLINYLLEYGKNNNIYDIFVGTEQCDNEDAIAFYRKTPFDLEMKVLQYSYDIDK